MEGKAVVSAFVVLVATAALAQTGAPGPAPAPEMAQLDVFLGHWTCTGQAPASELGPAHATKSTVSIGKDAGGSAVSFKFAVDATKDSPAVSGMGFWAWDPVNKRFVGPSVDNFGFYHETSLGWQGDRIAFEGEGIAMAKKAQVRDVFVKKSATELSHVYDMNTDGKWVTLGEETCHKAAAAKPEATKPAEHRQ